MRPQEMEGMMQVYRLSRIGDALPVSHIYPLGNDEIAFRAGAQCFADIDAAIAEAHYGLKMVPGADRLLIIRTTHDCLDWDESSWIIIQPADVAEVRSLELVDDPVATLTSFEDDDEAWSAATPVATTWIETIPVLCRSDHGDGGWSLHAPGSTDEAIAAGDAQYLVSGAAGWDSESSKWDRPNQRDYDEAVRLCGAAA